VTEVLAAVRHAPGRLLDVGGHRLWVESEGTGPPVVLLGGPGPAGSHSIFHPWFADLAADHEVHYLDLHGRGRSDQPADLAAITFAADVEDAATVIADLDAGPVHLYGFSYGGLVGQALALDHPGLVRSLTLANTVHSPLMWQLGLQNAHREVANQLPEEWERITAGHAAGVPSTAEPLAGLFARAAPLLGFRNPDSVSRLAVEVNAELHRRIAGDDAHFVAGGELPAIPDFRPRLRDLRVPAMVLTGRYDRVLCPALQREFVAANPRIALHVLERAGAFAHVEEIPTVLALLRAFIARSYRLS
jgi:proline iminopeptidase